MPDLMPLLFVGHGSPMNIIQQNEFTGSLRKAGAALPKPRCILCVSAHWVTDGTFVTGAARPKQIYDFYGFPDELYEVIYRASGSLQDAGRIAMLGKNIPVSPNNGWGIDHGTWAVLHHLYPQADIPVIHDDSKDRESGKNAVPTNEHYLPLLYIAALRGDTENIEYIHEGFQHRSVSMRSFIVR